MKRIIVQEVASHRNGCFGEGFHAVRFTVGGEALVGIVFAGEGRCAVLDPALALETVAFGQNSWRGDEYEPALRAAIASWEESRWLDSAAGRGPDGRRNRLGLRLIKGGLRHA